MNRVTRLFLMAVSVVLFGVASASAEVYDLTCTAPPSLNVDLQVEFYDPYFIPIPIQLPDGTWGFVDVKIPNWSPVTLTGEAKLAAVFTTANVPGQAPVTMYKHHLNVFTGSGTNRLYRFSGSYYDNTGTLRTPNVTSVKRP